MNEYRVFHNAPAADQDNPEGMAQSFSLANMVPQYPNHNRKLWSGIEDATRKYVLRAAGNVYVITGSYSLPGHCTILAPSCTIGQGVAVPTHIYKLIYDVTTNRAWGYWTENSDTEPMSSPITYARLVQYTGIDFLPGINPKD